MDGPSPSNVSISASTVSPLRSMSLYAWSLAVPAPPIQVPVQSVSPSVSNISTSNSTISSNDIQTGSSVFCFECPSSILQIFSTKKFSANGINLIEFLEESFWNTQTISGTAVLGWGGLGGLSWPRRSPGGDRAWYGKPLFWHILTWNIRSVFYYCILRVYFTMHTNISWFLNILFIHSIS